MASVTVTYYGVEATGRNVTEAKREAGRKIESFVRHHSPHYVKVGNSVAVIFPEPGGSTCTEYPLMCGEWRGDNCGCGFSGDTIEEAIASAVLQLAMHEDIGVDADDWKQIGDKKLRDKQRREYLYHQGFQTAYKAAPAELTECQRHEWACYHAREFTAPLTTVSV